MPDGTKYKESWLNDVKHGHGLCTWPDGAKYEEGWLNNEMHGHGLFEYVGGVKMAMDYSLIQTVINMVVNLKMIVLMVGLKKLMVRKYLSTDL